MKRNFLKRSVIVVVLALSIGGALSACGKKGDLEPPPADEEMQS